MKFSQRYGYTPVREIIQFESIDYPLRNKLWNLLDFYVWSDANSYGEYSQDLLYLCKSLMFGYFNKPIDEINKLWWKERIKIRQYFFECKWYEVYDFIEFIKDTEGIKSSLEILKNDLGKINSDIEDLKNSGNVQELKKRKGEKRIKEVRKNFNESALKFSEKYEILEPMKIDKKTKMSYTVIGNKENGTVEIIFGGSNSNFNPTSKEFGKTVKDWGGNGEAYFWGISSNQVAALETAREIQKRYLHGVEFKCTDGKTRTFKKLVGVNGHSKGGGEANYVASVLNLKSFTVDPAPCEKYGMYLNNNKFLSIVPNNGRGTLTEAVKVPTTNAYMMRQTAMSQGKILKTTTNIVAIPAQNMIRSVHTTFDEDHYASGKSAVENFKIAKESIKEKVSKTEKTPNFSGKYVMNLAERVAAAKISNKKENEKNTKTEQKNDYQR